MPEKSETPHVPLRRGFHRRQGYDGQGGGQVVSYRKKGLGWIKPVRESEPAPAFKLTAYSGFSAEAYVIVHIKNFEPGGDIFALGSDFGVKAVEVFPAFAVRGRAVFLVAGPMGDF